MHGFTITPGVNAELNSVLLLGLTLLATWLAARQSDIKGRQERQSKAINGLQNGEGEKKIIGTVKAMIADGLVHPGPAVPVAPVAAPTRPAGALTRASDASTPVDAGNGQISMVP